MAKTCHACDDAWDDKRSPGFREECARCAAPLHCCANCRFYDADASNWCREPQARDARPRDPEASNTCDYFVFADRGADDGASRETSAKDGLAALFGERDDASSKDDAPAWTKTDDDKPDLDSIFGGT